MFAAGSLMGGLFFGGLWFTVKKSISSKNPALRIFISFILRMGMALLGFYYMAQFGWQAMLLGLFGFTAARFIVTYFTERYDKKQNWLNKKTTYET